ncbi:hypothetical protein [Tenuibacillus multivorans]|uniref:Voltage-dependent anion channel n=1 Tax=Tenuibacillus multivorans TaxID=237069 RepID=A0A1H0ANF4_9BACI|nr:hypothetical protein [Tenuibacillus multivorans]GEL78214.1 hypothetical protein TMU01_24490 [Tenuibacillus multivorans]SDN34919.1 hypothetical protein SAMN05216498_2007 [Tenuibacillus multivorans]
MIKKRIDPASGAIIMANGIFLYGGIQAFPIMDLYLGKTLAILLFMAWIIIYSRLSIQFFQKDFFVPFINNPVLSFTMGTWIAGVSVLCNVLLKYFPNLLPALQVMAIINFTLWLIFLITMIKSFGRLIKKPTKYIHGVILLSTVGTQSIVILMKNLFSHFPDSLFQVFVILGIIFYVAGIYLLFKRYLSVKWKLTTDWKNTNCIIHGALSITGLAMVTAHLYSSVFLITFWIIVFSLLVVVEIIEIIRAYKRVHEFGFKKGVWTYDITQWSRNFTFGMFFAFTNALVTSEAYEIPNAIAQLQITLLPIWAWVVLFSIIVELIIFIQSKINLPKTLET